MQLKFNAKKSPMYLIFCIIFPIYFIIHKSYLRLHFMGLMNLFLVLSANAYAKLLEIIFSVAKANGIFTRGTRLLHSIRV